MDKLALLGEIKQLHENFNAMTVDFNAKLVALEKIAIKQLYTNFNTMIVDFHEKLSALEKKLELVSDTKVQSPVENTCNVCIDDKLMDQQRFIHFKLDGENLQNLGIIIAKCNLISPIRRVYLGHSVYNSLFAVFEFEKPIDVEFIKTQSHIFWHTICENKRSCDISYVVIENIALIRRTKFNYFGEISNIPVFT